MKKLRIYSFTLIVLMWVSFSVAVAGSSANVYESDEFLIDTSIVYVPAQGIQCSPSVAFDGTNYLVVWQDSSNGSNDIWGARVNPAGTVLDPAKISVTTAPYNQLSPSVAFDGTNYLVVWTDERNGSFDIYGARVSQAGTVLDPTGIAISTAANSQCYPSIAFDAENYLVVWLDFRNGSYSDIYGARVNPAGICLDPAGIAICAAANRQDYPSIAFGGQNCLVVWVDWRNGYPDIDIYGARVNRSGTVLDPAGIPIASSPLYQELPSVAFDGTNYLVVWQDARGSSYDIYGARVNPAGICLDTAGVPISTWICGQYSPKVNFDGRNYFVVWQDNRGSSYDIYGAQVNRSGTVLDPAGIPIASSNRDEKFPSVASDGTNNLVVWQDPKIFSNYDIYAARVNQFGTVLDTAGITVGTIAYDQLSPSVAFDGTNYFVVWQDGRSGSNYDIYAARVNQSGIVLDSAGFGISTLGSNQLLPSVAFDGTNYLVVWQDYRSGYSYDIYWARVSQSGIVLDSNGIGLFLVGDQYSPSVAFDGTNYLVVWGDARGNHSIIGARLNQAGVILDRNGIIISNAQDAQRYPSVAFDGTNYLVVWQDHRSGYSYDIYGARVNQTGTVLDTNGISISTEEEEQKYPSVVFDGTNYLVTWVDWRSGYYSDIYGARVNPAGTVIESFLVSNQEGNQLSLAIARGAENQVLITYSGWTGIVQGRTYNTMRIWGKFYPFTGIEEDRRPLSANPLPFEIYPNPVKSFLAIRLSQTADRQNLKIFDVSGKLIRVVNKVSSAQEHKEEMVISLKGINPGIYFLQLGTVTKKFIVTR